MSNDGRPAKRKREAESPARVVPENFEEIPTSLHRTLAALHNVLQEGSSVYEDLRGITFAANRHVDDQIEETAQLRSKNAQCNITAHLTPSRKSLIVEVVVDLASTTKSLHLLRFDNEKGRKLVHILSSKLAAKEKEAEEYRTTLGQQKAIVESLWAQLAEAVERKNKSAQREEGMHAGLVNVQTEITALLARFANSASDNH